MHKTMSRIVVLLLVVCLALGLGSAVLLYLLLFYLSTAMFRYPVLTLNPHLSLGQVVLCAMSMTLKNMGWMFLYWCVVLLALLTLGPAEAAGVLLTKTALSALLFGTPVSFLYAAAGGALSFGAMLLLNKRRSVTPIGQSIAGAVLHNLGQVLVAMLLTNTPRLLLYFTPLGLLGVLTGALSGLAAKLCAAKVSPFFRKNR